MKSKLEELKDKYEIKLSRYEASVKLNHYNKLCTNTDRIYNNIIDDLKELLSVLEHETSKVSINKEKKEVCRVCGDELEDSDIEDLCRHCWIDQHGM